MESGGPGVPNQDRVPDTEARRMPRPTRSIAAGLVAVAACLGQPCRAEAHDPVLATLEVPDPCSFYRGQAYGKGLAHFTTEMLWTCEAIAARRAAGMTLGDRLQAADMALNRYRAALLDAGRARFRSARAGAPRPGVLGLDDAAKRALAENSGALAALDAIRTGF